MAMQRIGAVGLLAAILGATSSAQTTERVSVDSSGIQGNWESLRPAISADGRYVAFESQAWNLVPGDTPVQWGDIFVHDRQSGTTERVSLGATGFPGNGWSYYPSISADGRYVAFTSVASNLVPGDTHYYSDIFVRDRQAGTTVRLSVDSGGAQGNSTSYAPSISADGRFVAFQSLASNLVSGDTNGFQDVFVCDVQTGSIVRVSVDSAGAEGDSDSVSASISADGRYVAFESLASNLVPGDTGGWLDIFVHDRQTGTIERVSVDSGGAEGNWNSVAPSISADGRYVAFTSSASNFVPGDTNSSSDAFVRDRQTGVTERVSVDSSGVQGNSASGQAALSADGRYVAFMSYARNLVYWDWNGKWDVFVHDRRTGLTERASVGPGPGIVEGNEDSSDPVISADGRCVAFHGYSSTLVTGDTNGALDVFLRDRGEGPAFTPFCFGDATAADCPCDNRGALGHGCQNSNSTAPSTGGAILTVAGVPSLSADTVQLTSSDEKPSALSIVLQGDAAIVPVNYGDGRLCVAGSLKPLYVKIAVGGVVVAPRGSDPSISARSAALGAPIPPGARRNYQVYYRDPDASYCPSPTGGTFNVSQAIAIVWGN